MYDACPICYVNHVLKMTAVSFIDIQGTFAHCEDSEGFTKQAERQHGSKLYIICIKSFTTIFDCILPGLFFRC